MASTKFPNNFFLLKRVLTRCDPGLKTFGFETIFPTLVPEELLEKLEVYSSIFDQA